MVEKYECIVILILSIIGVVGFTKLVLDFAFFQDKPKSFRRQYKKQHGVFYKVFCCYALNKNEMEVSKYKKWIKIRYLWYLIYLIFGFSLIVFVLFAEMSKQLNAVINVFILIYAILCLLFYFWFIAHLEGHGWWPGEWHHGTFYIQLPGMPPKSKRRQKR